MVDAPKTYHAVVRLGETTDTFDSEGAVVATADPSGVTQGDVERELSHFVGEIQQLPPMYSALKHEGQPLYRYARAGKTAPRELRTVTIYRLELRRFAPPVVELELACGRGAYVRTLVHDLGERLGCGAHVTELTRLQSGPFTLEEAVGLEEFRQAVEEGVWEELAFAPDRVLESWHAALLGRQHSFEARRGRLLVLAPVRQEFANLAPDTPCRAYSEDGEFLAILRYRGAGRWHPERVFLPL